MISRGIRAFAFSYLGVIFAIYLDRLGYFDGGCRNDLFRCLHQQRAAHGSLGISFRPPGAKTDLDAAGCLDHRFERHLPAF